MAMIETSASDFDRDGPGPQAPPKPRCEWCGGEGYARIAKTMLCTGCYEFAVLHWS